MKTVSEFDLLINELHQKAAVKHQPLVGTFELTQKCNLECCMCYIHQKQSNFIKNKNELSAKEWLKIAHQAVEEGMIFLTLTGGEIFRRPDFFDIYFPLTRMGLIITLFSNGTLINKKIAEELAVAPPNRIEITIYGSTAFTYEKVTGVPGSYSLCCKGIEALLRKHIPLSIKTTISKINIDEIDSMHQMAKNWGVPFSANWLLTKKRDGGESNIINCRLSANEGVLFEVNNRGITLDWMGMILNQPSVNIKNNFNCYAGQTTFSIDPYGFMNPCIDLTKPSVQPLEIGFDSAWKKIQNFVNSSFRISDACNKCDALIFCPRCPAWSLLESDSLIDPVPYLCEIAHSRKEYYEEYLLNSSNHS